MFNKGEYDIAAKVVAVDYVDHEPVPGNLTGREGCVATARWIRGAITDPRWTEEDAVATGDRVVMRVRFSGRHTGELMGIPATNRTFSVQHIHVYRVENGMIVEHWAVRDDLGMLQQLGVLPGPFA
jgi:predicted ester cyclase